MMAGPIPVVIGVDVGGTNTNAVIISKVKGEEDPQILAEDKCCTTVDVSKGVRNAVLSALRHASSLKEQRVQVRQINIGTSHLVNAVAQRRDLSHVSVIRLCGPASRILPPFSDFPCKLKDTICGSVHFVKGGYRIDGTEIQGIDEEEIGAVVDEIKRKGVKGIVVCGICSPTKPDHEEKVQKLIQKLYPEASITLSHTISHTGLLVRENAAILNEALKALCQRTVSGFRQALRDIGLSCPMFLTQNDGTLISEHQARETPVFTFASGPVNAMQGACFLTGLQNAIVVDIGGTTTDVGVLENGLPRWACTGTSVGGVRTNLRMPDVGSIALGGGSYVGRTTGNKTVVGPLSAGYRLTEEALVFGSASANTAPQSGRRVTATDVAVAAGLMDLGDSTLVAHVPQDKVKDAQQRIQRMVLEAADDLRVSLSDDQLPVVVVGGGARLMAEETSGQCSMSWPHHGHMANALGAALSQVKKNSALSPTDNTSDAATRLWTEPAGIDVMDIDVTTDVTKQLYTVTGDCIDPSETDSDTGVSWVGLTPSKPNVDAQTGEWTLNAWDVECTATGAGILGAGGGFTSRIGQLRARALLAEGKTMKIVSPGRLLAKAGPKDYLAMVAVMGAPSAILEQLISGQETLGAARCLEDLYDKCIGGYADGELTNKKGVEVKEKDGVTYIDDYQPVHVHRQQRTRDAGGQKVVGVISLEVGGTNCLEPLLLSSALGVPLVDADGMGRAFPKLSMFLPFIHGENCHPAALVDEKGRRCVVLKADSPEKAEGHLREAVTTMGSLGGVVVPIVCREGLKDIIIHRSYSRIWAIGDSILRARQQKEDPIQALMKVEDVKVLAVGKITGITYDMAGGFNLGRIDIKGKVYDRASSGQLGAAAAEERYLQVDSYNENMVARQVDKNGKELKVLATIPDIIALVNPRTAEAIHSEEAHYSQRVLVLVLPAPPPLTTPTALQTVGPGAFGYKDLQYRAAGQYREPVPLVPL